MCEIKLNCTCKLISLESFSYNNLKWSLMKPIIIKLVVQLEEIHQEIGHKIDPPSRKVTVAIVIKNPYAGKYVKNLEPLYDLGAIIGEILAKKGVESLRVKPSDIVSYGKGAIVGLNGEIEHAAAILHPRFGKPVREAVEKGDDIIPSTKKMGSPGSLLVMPITNKNKIWSFDHMDATEISIADAPRSDEILVALSLADSGRPLARTG